MTSYTNRETRSQRPCETPRPGEARHNAISNHILRQTGVVVSCLVAFAATASASLIGDTVTVEFAGFPTVSVVVGAGVELPNAGPTLGLPGPGRFDIDLDASSIRIDFTQLASYGPGASFTFSGLDPSAGGDSNCTVSSVTAVSNFNPLQYDPSADLTFTSNSIRIGFGPFSGSGVLNWNSGEFIRLDIGFDCPVSVEGSTWGSVKQLFR